MSMAQDGSNAQEKSRLMNGKTNALIVLLGLLGAVLLAVMATANGHTAPAHTAVAVAAAPSLAGEPVANCRYGAAPLDRASLQTISKIGAGWYLNFGMNPGNPPPPNGSEFVNMIRVKQAKDGDVYLPSFIVEPPLDATLANRIKNNPGQLYIAGNEVDRIGQGEMFPDVYARAYHEIYSFVKRNDPTAQVANSGLVQVTPNRLQYLDLVWKHYLATYGTTMPVDVWTMHLYVLPEVTPQGQPNGIANVALGTDPSLGKRESGGDKDACALDEVYCFAEHDDLSIFAEQVVAMRQWMKTHGQQNKPLLITEYSVLYPYELDEGSCFIQDEFGNCFTPQRISDFMVSTYAYLNSASNAELGYPLDGNRLVQRWMWFSVYYEQEGASSNLAQTDRVTLTRVGQTFKSQVEAQSRFKNLVAEQPAPVRIALEGNNTTTAVLKATFRNNGNEMINAPFQVSFYRNAALTQLIGTVTIEPGVGGCATLPYTATVEWPDLAEGMHNYWIHVDSGGNIPEVPQNNGDNIAQGTVFVYEQQLRLPVVISDQ